MMRINRRQPLAALLLAFLILAGSGAAQLSVRAAAAEETLQKETRPEEPQRGNGFPYLNEAGFLDEGEYIEENAEEGVWRYASETLRIEILRRETDAPKEIWYEAEIWCAEGSGGRRAGWRPRRRSAGGCIPCLRCGSLRLSA